MFEDLKRGKRKNPPRPFSPCSCPAGPSAEDPEAHGGGGGGPGSEAEGQAGRYLLLCLLVAAAGAFGCSLSSFCVSLQSQAERERLPVCPGTLTKLRAHIEAVILALPEDLQGILHKPPTP